MLAQAKSKLDIIQRQDQLIQLVQLRKMELHPITEEMRKGAYFQYPTIEQLLDKVKTPEYYGALELNEIRFNLNSRNEGITMVQMVWQHDN